MYAPPPIETKLWHGTHELVSAPFSHKKVKYNIKIEHGNTWCAPLLK